MWADYRAECETPGCPGKLLFEHAISAGLQIGDMIPYDHGVPEFGKCPHCKRHAMRVTDVPDPPPIPGPVGFTKVPTE